MGLFETITSGLTSGFNTVTNTVAPIIKKPLDDLGGAVGGFIASQQTPTPIQAASQQTALPIPSIIPALTPSTVAPSAPVTTPVTSTPNLISDITKILTPTTPVEIQQPVQQQPTGMISPAGSTYTPTEPIYKTMGAAPGTGGTGIIAGVTKQEDVPYNDFFAPKPVNSPVTTPFQDVASQFTNIAKIATSPSSESHNELLFGGPGIIYSMITPSETQPDKTKWDVANQDESKFTSIIAPSDQWLKSNTAGPTAQFAQDYVKTFRDRPLDATINLATSIGLMAAGDEAAPAQVEAAGGASNVISKAPGLFKSITPYIIKYAEPVGLAIYGGSEIKSGLEGTKPWGRIGAEFTTFFGPEAATTAYGLATTRSIAPTLENTAIELNENARNFLDNLRSNNIEGAVFLDKNNKVVGTITGQRGVVTFADIDAKMQELKNLGITDVNIVHPHWNENLFPSGYTGDMGGSLLRNIDFNSRYGINVNVEGIIGEKGITVYSIPKSLKDAPFSVRQNAAQTYDVMQDTSTNNIFNSYQQYTKSPFRDNPQNYGRTGLPALDINTGLSIDEANNQIFHNFANDQGIQVAQSNLGDVPTTENKAVRDLTNIYEDLTSKISDLFKSTPISDVVPVRSSLPGLGASLQEPARMTPYQQALWDHATYTLGNDLNSESFLRNYPTDDIAKREYLKLLGPDTKVKYIDSNVVGDIQNVGLQTPNTGIDLLNRETTIHFTPEELKQSGFTPDEVKLLTQDQIIKMKNMLQETNRLNEIYTAQNNPLNIESLKLIDKLNPIPSIPFTLDDATTGFINVDLQTQRILDKLNNFKILNNGADLPNEILELGKQSYTGTSGSVKEIGYLNMVKSATGLNAGKIISHNHPGNIRSLSYLDILKADTMGAKEITAVTSDGTIFGAKTPGWLTDPRIITDENQIKISNYIAKFYNDHEMDIAQVRWGRVINDFEILKQNNPELSTELNAIQHKYLADADTYRMASVMNDANSQATALFKNKGTEASLGSVSPISFILDQNGASNQLVNAIRKIEFDGYDYSNGKIVADLYATLDDTGRKNNVYFIPKVEPGSSMQKALFIKPSPDIVPDIKFIDEIKSGSSSIPIQVRATGRISQDLATRGIEKLIAGFNGLKEPATGIDLLTAKSSVPITRDLTNDEIADMPFSDWIKTLVNNPEKITSDNAGTIYNNLVTSRKNARVYPWGQVPYTNTEMGGYSNDIYDQARDVLANKARTTNGVTLPRDPNDGYSDFLQVNFGQIPDAGKKMYVTLDNIADITPETTTKLFDTLYADGYKGAFKINTEPYDAFTRAETFVFYPRGSANDENIAHSAVQKVFGNTKYEIGNGIDVTHSVSGNTRVANNLAIIKDNFKTSSNTALPTLTTTDVNMVLPSTLQLQGEPRLLPQLSKDNYLQRIKGINIDNVNAAITGNFNSQTPQEIADAQGAARNLMVGTPYYGKTIDPGTSLYRGLNNDALLSKNIGDTITNPGIQPFSSSAHTALQNTVVKSDNYPVIVRFVPSKKIIVAPGVNPTDSIVLPRTFTIKDISTISGPTSGSKVKMITIERKPKPSAPKAQLKKSTKLDIKLPSINIPELKPAKKSQPSMDIKMPSINMSIFKSKPKKK
jgi:hypothetical protein